MSKITESAKNKSCINCGNNEEGKVCARHYNGLRSSQYGKGRGIKCHDLASADLCDKCDDQLSEQNYAKYANGSKNIDRSEEFLHLCMLTNIRRMNDGVIK